jgi:hypothetical protein
VVDHGDQHVFLVADSEKPCLHWDLGCQVEGVAGRSVDGLLQPLGRPCGGVDDLPAEVRPLDRHDQLLRDSVGRREQRAQALMASHHVGQRRAQRILIDPPAEPQRHRHVVDG